MADHAKPTLGSTYTEVLAELTGRLEDLAAGMDPAKVTVSNVPADAIRWSSASKKWQYWNGTSWADLAAEFAINISGTAAKLKTPRAFQISGGATASAVNFDGSAAVDLQVTALDASKLTGTADVDTTGNAGTATALKNSRTFSITGDMTATGVSFDGTGNVNLVASSNVSVSDATTSTKGIAKIAPDDLTDSASDGSTIITPKHLGIITGPRGYSFNASVQFTGSSNQISVTNIVPKLGLELGDVISVEGTSSNNNTYTVESITNDSTIIVNYEHRNNKGAKTLTNETVSCDIGLVAKWFEAPLGLGQSWVDLKLTSPGPVRRDRTTYYAPTNRSLAISINVGGYEYGCYIMSEYAYIAACSGSYEYAFNLYAIIPAGKDYLFANWDRWGTTYFDPEEWVWTELR